MSASSAGVAEVETRLRAIRWRLNSLALQHSAFLAGSVVAVAVTLVVATALRGRLGLFGVALWTAIGATGTAVAYGVLRVRRAWLSLEQTAHFTDQQAGLDDRLATLLAQRAGAPPSRLLTILLDQVLAEGPRWNVQALSPRRVARSAWLLIAALATLIATSFYARPSAPPQSTPPTHGRERTEADEFLFQPVGKPAADPPGSTDRTLTIVSHDSTDDGVAAHGESSIGQIPAAHPQPGAAGVGPAPEDGRGREGSSSIERGQVGTSGLNEQLQQAIRRSFGDGADGTHRRRSAADDRSTSQQRDPGSRTQPPNEPNQDAHSDRSRMSKPPSAQTAPQPRAGGEHGGSGAAAGQNGAQLFTSQPVGSVSADPKQAQALPIKLGAFTTMAPSQVEPQRPAPPLSTLTGASATHADSTAQLSDAQVPDAPLHKTDVAPEHEAIIRRIFTRDE